MAGSVALGIRQTAAGVGTTDSDLRHILRARWCNRGVITGLDVTGLALAYRVSAGVAVCSRSDSDGYTEAYFGGGTTPGVTANASSSPRIDVVWLCAHDASQGDADNLVTLGVTQGQAAAAPTAPAIPAYATEVARMLVPGSATTMAGATVADSKRFAIPYGASLGILADVRDRTQETVSATNASWHTRGSATITLPTDRMVEVSYARTATTHDFGSTGSIVADVQVDGSSVVTSELAFSGAWETRELRDVVRMTAGTHTVSVRDGWHEGAAVEFIATKSGYQAANVGMRMLVVDRGVA